MTARAFHLGDVLSVTTGLLVSPRRVEALYDVLNWMTGDDLFTHQLPRAMDECRPEVLRQHPDLVDVAVPDGFRDEAHVWEWLAEQTARFGEFRDLSPLAAADHTVIGPFAELRMMRPNMPVVGVALPPEDGAL